MRQAKLSQPMWEPSPGRVAAANLTRFMNEAGQSDFASLYRWSIVSPERFWARVWQFCGIVGEPGGEEEVVRDLDQMPGAKWFPRARLNFAENLLRHRDDHPALVFCNERGEQRRLSYRQLYDRVAALARWLGRAGVARGDRVVGFLPNLPETVIAMLAATSLGAVWSSCSPDFGSAGVVDRFGQIGAKVLFAADGYHYAGKRVDLLERIRHIIAKLPTIERTVVIPYANADPDPGALPGATLWADEFDGAGGEIEFATLPFDHPLYIMYSSGTTGVPKCIVHGAGGTLIQHLKELVLHTDVKREDRVFYFTTCGWMMWNWLVSTLAAGATVMLYDGSPLHPSPAALWEWAAREKITVFGASAAYLAAIEKAGVSGEGFDLAALRTILSTGSPLAPESFDYVYRDIKQDVQLSSISGGTDIISCFALGNPIGPVWRGELQTRGLGMRVEIRDDSGLPLRGQKGELSCSMPFPSMPIFFWNDEGGQRYRESYFARFPGVWTHGDWAELTEHDGLIIYGRSDATLNPGGVRIGTAEIYRVVGQLPDVLDSLAVAQTWGDDVRVVLFVVLRAGVHLSDELCRAIRARLRDQASPRHVPAKIIAVPAIPRTISGKIVELAVQNVIHGREVKNRDALANPEALDYFKDLPDLQS